MNSTPHNSSIFSVLVLMYFCAVNDSVEIIFLFYVNERYNQKKPS